MKLKIRVYGRQGGSILNGEVFQGGAQLYRSSEVEAGAPSIGDTGRRQGSTSTGEIKPVSSWNMLCPNTMMVCGSSWLTVGFFPAFQDHVNFE